MGSPNGAPLPFRRAMPRALLVVFATLAVLALAVIAFAIFASHPSGIALQDRRPPPSATHSHEVGKIFPAPVPRDGPHVRAPCREVRGTRAAGGEGFVARVEEVLEAACTLAGSGVDPILPEAVEGLRVALIRVAEFERTGVEATTETATRTIWLNLRLADRRTPVTHIVPVLLHEALHVARAATPTASAELEARRAEAAACRELIALEDWPRWCRDARALADMPEDRVLGLLRGAGYR